MSSKVLHICHIIYRFDVGGMENGIVNLINNMSPHDAVHTIISLTFKTDFSQRLQRSDVNIIELHKKSGNDIGMFLRLFKLLRSIKPDVVHTRNHPTTEIPFIAKLAGVKACVHGEHGRDVHDLDGSNRKFRILKKTLNPFINRYICVSLDLQNWLVNFIGIPSDKITQIYNGVDSNKFIPSSEKGLLTKEAGFKGDVIVIGAVGRMEEVKGHQYFVDAFIELLNSHPDLIEKVRLVILGDGQHRQKCLHALNEAGYSDYAWLPGSVNNVYELLPEFDVFVLPSLAEGISNTILEAMSCGLPVIATDVGGNPELIKVSETGILVPPSSVASLTEVMARYATDITLREKHGSAARKEIEKKYSMNAMVKQYLAVYQTVLS